MAQVTMEGREYADMLKTGFERDDLLNIFKQAQRVSFTEESLRSYSAGEFKDMEYPTWVQDALILDMEAQLNGKSDEEFALWVKSDKPVYRYKSREFVDSRYHDDDVDMLSFSKQLRVRWDRIKAAMAAVVENVENVKEDE